MTPAESSPQIEKRWGQDASRHQHHSHRRSIPALELEIEQLSARVGELEREKADLEEFAAVAAHELVEPLVMTEAYATMVIGRLDEQAHAESRRDLDALARGAARLRLLVETLLHDARSSGRSLRHRPVDLNAVVRECLTVLRPEIEARRTPVEVGELPEVVGDESLLSGLFVNLLINALKYSPRHGGTIRVGAGRDGSLWRLFVDSDGPTIPPEDRHRIFEPFHRGRHERRTRGAGLGLAISRRIVERHGGRIGVTATNGSGNRFFFTLPA
jgi:signal transduction histidine kinase